MPSWCHKTLSSITCVNVSRKTKLSCGRDAHLKFSSEMLLSNCQFQVASLCPGCYDSCVIHMMKLSRNSLIYDFFLLHSKPGGYQVCKLVMTNKLLDVLKIACGEAKGRETKETIFQSRASAEPRRYVLKVCFDHLSRHKYCRVGGRYGLQD